MCLTTSRLKKMKLFLFWNKLLKSTVCFPCYLCKLENILHGSMFKWKMWMLCGNSLLFILQFLNQKHFVSLPPRTVMFAHLRILLLLSSRYLNDVQEMPANVLVPAIYRVGHKSLDKNAFKVNY
jgi:hypothetical protein